MWLFGMAVLVSCNLLWAADPGTNAAAAEERAREASERRAAVARAAHMRRLQAHRSGGAHARMPSTMYASTPSAAARGPLACPVAPDAVEDVGPFAPPGRYPNSPVPYANGPAGWTEAAPRQPFFVSSRRRPAAALECVRASPAAASSSPAGRGVSGHARRAPYAAVERALAARGAADLFHAVAADDGAAPELAAVRPSAVGDFNGDGMADVLLRHGDGRWRLYAMDGRRHLPDESGDLELTADRAWAFAGIGDLNGDGRADVLLRHDDGSWLYQAMNGARRIEAESGAADDLPTDAAWRIAGIGDFDADGRDDLLLRHDADRGWHLYLMDGREVGPGGGAAALTRNAAWRVAGVGDLDGDGAADVLLRHENGTWHYYALDGLRPDAGKQGRAALTANPRYAFAGVGDFNGDGADDVMLRRDDGLWYFYPMSGREVLPGRGATNLSRNPELSLAGIGDFDGDGSDDILLRRDSGGWHHYRMDGIRFAADGSGAADLASDAGWRLAGEADAAFRDCADCPEMVQVPAGRFEMGSPETEAGRSDDEGPRREVSFAEPFAMGVHEVTFAQWEACVADGGCGGYRPSDFGWGGGGRPVMDVTWEQAGAYARWLSERTGESYRLPSEAEWEYAARAGTTTPFHTGATISTEQANYDGALPPYGDGAAGESRGATLPVGGFPANAFGLRDMHGNVAEWTADCHAPDYRDAPAHGGAVESENCSGRVFRGGSWRDGPEELRSANRTAGGVGWYDNTAGFRIARDLAAPEPAETAADVYGESVSPVVQSRCVNCHVAGGVSGHTRLVFVRNGEADYLATNLAVFETFLADVEDGDEVILNKIQGVGHGGGVQVAAGTDEFKGVERFLGLLSGGAGGGTAVTPATLFDGVGMESARSTLRRAAIVFAGRIPTDEEYESIKTGGLASLRTAIRGLMRGPGFHEFLIRNANDRLLTDRDMGREVIERNGFFVEYTNEVYRRAKAAGGLFTADSDDLLWRWVQMVQYGAARAPLELVAHVVENELSYAELLTADYIMANPMAAEAYGASTPFEDPADEDEFRPSEIVSYYRDDESKKSVVAISEGTVIHVTQPGDLLTNYPHAGILNTTVFLLRYPTTPTNRNRARARWTYYHFLGLDVEKSAPRTTDPVALADTNNPTMHNSACTVCHQVLDPVGATFQNYGDTGLYRDQGGGLDSLDDQYKYSPSGGIDFSVSSRTRQGATVDIGIVRLFGKGDNELGLKNLRTLEGDTKLHLVLGEVVISDLGGNVVQRYEVEEAVLEQSCGESINEGYKLWDCSELLVLPLAVPSDGDYRVQVEAWVLEGGVKATTLRAWMPGPFYRHGDSWYRDMRKPGFDRVLAPNAERSLQWLAERIVSDPRFAESTVKFWWPSIMGVDIATPPAQGDADFDGRLLVANAQVAEMGRLAQRFRRGFHGGEPYNLKDLLTEIALSKWFRADALPGTDPIQTAALGNAGARRLLTPEELSRKTVALMGFDWKRRKRESWESPGDVLNWTNADWQYGLLYGGIDSDGITKRGRDLTSVMAGVAQRHATATACPVVMKDFYLVAEEERRLFGGLDPTVSPTREFGGTFEIAAASRADMEMLSVEGPLRAGDADVKLAFLNDFWDEERGDRDILLDRLALFDGENEIYRFEMEDLDHEFDCHHIEQDAFHLSGSGPDCVLSIPLNIPRDGTYRVELAAWGDQAGDQLPKLEIAVESDTERSAGARAIKAKLVELHNRLLGVEVDAEAADVRAAFDLFVEVWRRGQTSEHGNFRSVRCEWPEDAHYFDGVADDFWRDELDENGGRLGWDWDRVNAFFEEHDWSDPRYIARTWVVVLAYLMTDPRYLHL